MNVVVMVNSSPLGSTLSATALRFVSACAGAGLQVRAVYFRGDGVYNLLEGPMSDDSLPAVKTAWVDCAERHGAELLVCSADVSRRLPEASVAGAGFTVAGLARWWQLVEESDRMVCF